jgi:hypothetical protein
VARRMLRLGRAVLAIFLCVACLSSYAQLTSSSIEKKIVVSTYFPSPYAFFKELRLIPHEEHVTDCDNLSAQGTVHLNDQNQLLICDGKGGWNPLGGGHWRLTDNNLHMVDQDWSVGIGTATPAYKLDVAGQMNGRTGVCIGDNCKPSWDAASCPEGQCMTSANFDESPAGYTCTPCGGVGGEVLEERPLSHFCSWVSIPPGYTNPPTNDCGGWYTGVLWACACPVGYTDIREGACTGGETLAKRYWDGERVWLLCEGRAYVGCTAYGPIQTSVKGDGWCTMYQP